jgi:ADP-ribosylglycohydrolase
MNWAFHDAKDFREAVLRAVNLGDDADTTGLSAASLPVHTGASRGFRRNGGRGSRGRK